MTRDACAASHKAEECRVCRGVSADSACQDTGGAASRDTKAPATECKYVVLRQCCVPPQSFAKYYLPLHIFIPPFFYLELTFELTMTGSHREKTTSGTCVCVYVSCVRRVRILFMRDAWCKSLIMLLPSVCGM